MTRIQERYDEAIGAVVEVLSAGDWEPAAKTRMAWRLLSLFIARFRPDLCYVVCPGCEKAYDDLTLEEARLLFGAGRCPRCEEEKEG